MSQVTTVKAKVAKHVEVHNPTETHKMTVHLSLVLTGILITIALTYIPSDLLLHLAPLGIGIPQMIQEGIDRLVKGF